MLGDQRRAGAGEGLREGTALGLGAGLALEVGDGALALAAVEGVARRVDEVVEAPSAATPAPASDGSNVWIVALGGGVLAALMAGLLLRIRHRRAPTPPAAPEAPG